MQRGETLEQKRRVQAHFEGSEGWQGVLYREPRDRYAKQVVRRKYCAFTMVDRLAFPSSPSALDVGCGPGVYLEELARRGFRTFGVDASEAMIRSCRERLTSTKESNVKLFQGDVETLPFRDASFDLVLCIGVLGYLLTEEKAISEIKRVLKPGGYWIVSIENALSVSNMDYYLRQRIRSALFHRYNDYKVSERALSVASPWVERSSHTHHQYRLFFPRRFEESMASKGFRLCQGMTLGLELRLLRKLGILSAGIVDKLELKAEHILLNSRFTMIRYLGEAYTGLLQKKDTIQK